MSTVHEIIEALCKQHGVSGAKMCLDLGMSKSFMTELRKGRSKGIKAETAAKIADYFGVSIEYLLGNEQKKETTAKAGVSDEEIRFALSGGDGEITDEQFEEVKKFVQFIKERDKK